MKQEMSDISSKKSSNASDMSQLQKERDDLVLKNEQLNELLSKNNLQVPSNMSQEKTSSGKRTQALIDEYKTKMQKA